MRQVTLATALSLVLAPSFGFTRADLGDPDVTSETRANTSSTSKDPNDAIDREAKERIDQIRSGSDDRQRWKKVKLYSDAPDPKRLIMPLLTGSNTMLSLDPTSGKITIASPEQKHVFEFAPAKGSPDNPCPLYIVQVIDASKEHALIRKTCPKFEYKPGRSFKSYDYYLYDRQTATMRDIWSASAMENLSLLQSPSPELSVSNTADGYKFQWKGEVASGGSMTMYNFNNMYIRQRNKDGKLELVCKDMLSGKQGEVESNRCEGGVLPLVPN
ncbi:hypothetical protein GM658_07835 [Pseudoduganella eburnea]|uniref:Secreted protein n=1 Tax=Massilia eburnea TaxID=1776165 RepID=A0A6L6QFT8_9BURK|nr:hypothetical protein [Massilia eburnea]MTW10513.1 hypothetical protein [Massilia eburnea]